MLDHILVEKLALGDNGLRVVVKDSIDIAGFATRGGSAALADAPVATRHADVVEALLCAGCRIVGKANMHELAYGVTGVNAWTGTPLNPRYPEYVPGGSSSGSAAAVAAGLCDFAIGTDTGGSIRTPAACCGIFGFKPSFGRVSRKGAYPPASSLDCIGPLAASMAMIEQAMAILAPGFVRGAAPAGLRLGQVAVEADPAVLATFEHALHAGDASLTAMTLTHFDRAFAANIAIIDAETWAAFGHLAGSDALGADVKARLLNARTVTAAQLAEAEDIRSVFRAEVDAALAGVDALVLPTLPLFPLTLADAADATAALRLTALVRPFNLSGHPALSLPVQAPNGLPIGIQLVGRIGEDAALCAIGRVLTDRLAKPTPQTIQELSL